MRIRILVGRLALSTVLIFILASNTWGQKRPQLNITCQAYQGVQRVVVSTSNGKPALNDIPFGVVIKVHDHRGLTDIIVEESVLKKGAVVSTVDLPFFHTSNVWPNWDVLVEQDFNRRFNKNTDLVQTTFQSNNGWYRGDWILYVSSNIVSSEGRKFSVGKTARTSFNSSIVGVADPKLLPSFAKSVDPYISQGLISNGTITSDLSVLQSAAIPIQSLPPGEFFEDWVSLHGFKAVLLSINDLRLISKSTNKIKALRRWVSVGGNLIVSKVGNKFAHRNEVIQIMGRPSGTTQWREPYSQVFQQKSSLIERGDLTGGYRNATDDTPQEAMKPLESVGRQAFISSTFLRGSVILIPDDMTTWKKEDWLWLHTALSMSSSVEATLGTFAKERHYLQGFSIPGIGKPPVRIFQFLIGLFVLVIGPLSYYLCQSSGRPYLLLATTPLFAFFAVFSLLAYGIFSDGFGLKGRSQTVSRIDHKLNSGFTNSRQVFYSGVSPGFCQFSAECLTIDSRSDFSQPSQRVFQGAVQTISGGQIKARSPFQFSTLDCFETDRQLSMLGTGSQATVTNGFESSVRLAVLKSGNDWYLAKDIPPQGSAAAEVVELQQARTEVERHLGRQVVENYAVGNARQRWRYMSAGQYQWGYCSTLTGELERSDSFRRIFDDASYVAIVETAPQMPEPLRRVDYNDSQLNIIVGSW